MSSGSKLTLSEDSGTANAAANSKVSFTVNYNEVPLTDSNVTVTSSQSWATCTWTGSTSTVTVTCTNNTSISATRSATITVTYGGNNVKYTLTQSKGTWTVNPSEFNPCQASGDSYVACQVNGSWISSGVTFKNYPSWVNRTMFSGGGGYIYYDENTNSNSRTGTVTAVYQKDTKTITINQKGTADLLSVRFADGNTYSYDNWPSNSTPIGIVIPNTNAFMSLVNMDYTKPDTGSVSSTGSYNNENMLYFGSIDAQIMLTKKTNVDEAKVYMPGTSNFNAIINYDNSNSTAWQTASAISNIVTDIYTHPAAQCCWRFHTEGTNQGEWYIPSTGEIYNALVKETSSKLICTTSALMAKYPEVPIGYFYTSRNYWTSTGSHNGTVGGSSFWIGYGNGISSNRQANNAFLVRAFHQL